MIAQTKSGQAVPSASGSSRPVGIAIISILGMIVSVLAVVGGIGLSILGVAGDIFLGTGGFLTAVGALFGIILIVLGIIGLVAWFWVWKMKKNGLVIAMVLLIISIINSILQLFDPLVMAGGVVGLIIGIIFAGYLYSKRSLFH